MMRSVPAVGAPQPWPSPPPPPLPPPSPSSTNATDSKTNRNCPPGICSLDCPQWCNNYLILPPPPPFFLDSPDDGSDSDSDSSRISPLMAALIAVLAAAFLLLFYYTVVSRFCRRRQRRRSSQILNNPNSSDDAEIRLDPMVHDPGRPAGLDESFIRQITVFKYRRSDGLVEGTECAVCLSEFNEEENLRLMPNCEHAFHIPCIDAWLKSHSSCPLCRSTMDPLPARPGPNPSPSPNGAAAAVSVAAMQVQSSNDVVLVVREVDVGDGEAVICHEVVAEEGEEEERENGEEEVRKGSVSQR